MPSPQDVKPAAILITLAVVVGGVLRFSGLSNRDFWYDESCTFIYVHNLFDWPADSNLLTESTNLPYYFLLSGWVGIVGESEAGFRSFSALAATLTIGILAWCAYMLGGRRAAIVCAVLVAIHPLHIHYAREARAYALWIMVLALATALLIKAVRSGRRGWWIGFAAVALFSLHLHYYTMFWLAFTGAALLISRERTKAFRHWLIATVVVGLLFLPYFLLAVWPASRGGGSEWIVRGFDPLYSPIETAMAFVPGGRYPAQLAGLSTANPDTLGFGSTLIEQLASIASMAAFVVTVLAFYLAIVGWRQSSRVGDLEASSPDARATLLALVIMVAGPLLLAWGYSVLVRPIYLPGRYDLVAWPAFMVLLSLAVARVAFAQVKACGSGGGPDHSSTPDEWRKSARTEVRGSQPVMASTKGWRIQSVLVCLFVACSAFPLARQLLPIPGKSTAHARADAICALVGAGDVVITLSYDREYLAYYLHRCGFAGALASFPTWLDGQLGWVDTPADLARGEHAWRSDAEALINSLGGQRLWLAADALDPEGHSPRGPINQALYEALAGQFDFIPASDEALLWRLEPK